MSEVFVKTRIMMGEKFCGNVEMKFGFMIKMMLKGCLRGYENFLTLSKRGKN